MIMALFLIECRNVERLEDRLLENDFDLYVTLSYSQLSHTINDLAICRVLFTFFKNTKLAYDTHCFKI